jgi:hypothetical protein
MPDTLVNLLKLPGYVYGIIGSARPVEFYERAVG